MAAVSNKCFNNDVVSKEIIEVIKESAGIISYEVKRNVEVDDVVTTTITLELLWDSEGKKLIV